MFMMFLFIFEVEEVALKVRCESALEYEALSRRKKKIRFILYCLFFALKVPDFVCEVLHA